MYWSEERQKMLLTVALCVLVTIILMTSIALFFLRRRSSAREKIKNLTQLGDSEVSRDYQVKELMNNMLKEYI